MSKLRLAVLALAAASAVLAGCSQKIEAPYDRGVCWHVVPLTGGKVKGIRFSTLEAICACLDCQPGEILEWVPDEGADALKQAF